MAKAKSITNVLPQIFTSKISRVRVKSIEQRRTTRTAKGALKTIQPIELRENIGAT